MINYEVTPLKRLQNLFSWSEFYFANKNKVKYDECNKQINELKEQIYKQNVNLKGK